MADIFLVKLPSGDWLIVNGPYWWKINIGLGKGLVMFGNKPLPEPMLTKLYVTIQRH